MIYSKTNDWFDRSPVMSRYRLQGWFHWCHPHPKNVQIRLVVKQVSKFRVNMKINIKQSQDFENRKGLHGPPGDSFGLCMVLKGLTWVTRFCIVWRGLGWSQSVSFWVATTKLHPLETQMVSFGVTWFGKSQTGLCWSQSVSYWVVTLKLRPYWLKRTNSQWTPVGSTPDRHVHIYVGSRTSNSRASLTDMD